MNVLANALLWILAGAVLGFAVAMIFADSLGLPRRFYLLAYIPLAGGFSILFFLVQGIHIPRLFLRQWPLGLLGAALVGTAAIKNVLSQPSSPRRQGWELIRDLLWPGLAYGLVDGLLLSVVPVVAVTRGFSGETWSQAGWGALAVGAMAFLASLFVTAAYHLGYSEFRGKKPLFGALVGNGLFTLAYLFTGSPLAAVVPHMAMHVAVMLHGPDSTLQLPPHRTEPSLASTAR